MRLRAATITLSFACLLCLAEGLTSSAEAGIIPWVWDTMFGPVGSIRARRAACCASYGPACCGATPSCGPCGTGSCSTGYCGTWGSSYNWFGRCCGLTGGCGSGSCGVSGCGISGCGAGDCGLTGGCGPGGCAG